MLAALVLQVMDRAESAAVKVMIYLIEGVLPEGYFADNLRGLSVDMAVFRDLLRARLPKLSKHLEALQNDAKDKPTGNQTGCVIVTLSVRYPSTDQRYPRGPGTAYEAVSLANKFVQAAVTSHL